MNEITYKGWTIRETDEPWALAAGLKYEYSNDERLHLTLSIEQAKEEIDELTYPSEDND